MLIDASHFNCVISNNLGNLHCTVYRMNDCTEGTLRLRVLDHMIDHKHRVLDLPKFAN